MKKYCLFIAFLLPLLISGCSKDELQPAAKDADYITVDAKKALTGTFVEFFGKKDWAPYQWNSLLEGMKKIGMNTVIVQYAAYNDNVWFNSDNTFTKDKSKYALARLLAAAELKHMDVYIGLYFNEEYWKHQTDIEWLKLHADRCISIAQEINAQFGNSTAFNGKPVAIAAFWNSDLSTPEQLQHFMAELSKCNLQVIMLQDGVGVEHVKLDKITSYYESAEKGLYTENTAYKGEFWTDLETFSKSGSSASPASLERIKYQLSAELSVSKVSKAVSFNYYNDMCPTGPFGKTAEKLRQGYYNYISTFK